MIQTENIHVPLKYLHYSKKFSLAYVLLMFQSLYYRLFIQIPHSQMYFLFKNLPIVLAFIL